MESIELKVKLIFSKGISKETAVEVAENVTQALMDRERTEGLIYDSTVGYPKTITKTIEVEGETVFLIGDVKTDKIETV